MLKMAKMLDVADRQKPLRAAAYCRVSTRQKEQDGSIEQQEQYYAQVISNHPNWTNAGVFLDLASGLHLKDQSAFQTMMKLCRRGKIDLILVNSFSDERMEMLITVFCAFAQSESKNMSQNIRWGVRQGFRMGTSGYADFVCYGYKRGDDGRLTIDEPDAETVRRIFQMQAEGKALALYPIGSMKTKCPHPQARNAGAGKPSAASCSGMRSTLAMYCFRRYL